VEAAPRNVISFRSADMDIPFVSHNDAMWSYFEPELGRRLAELEADGSFTARVQLVVRDEPERVAPPARGVANAPWEGAPAKAGARPPGARRRQSSVSPSAPRRPSPAVSHLPQDLTKAADHLPRRPSPAVAHLPRRPSRNPEVGLVRFVAFRPPLNATFLMGFEVP
jgi:hypothetical protein